LSERLIFPYNGKRRLREKGEEQCGADTLRAKF